MLNSVVKIPLMFAHYFEYYGNILGGGRFFVDTLYMKMANFAVVATYRDFAIPGSFVYRYMQIKSAYFCLQKY